MHTLLAIGFATLHSSPILILMTLHLDPISDILQVRKSISTVASSLEKYHATGLNHKNAGDSLCDSLSNAARAFKGDKFMEEPLNKV